MQNRRETNTVSAGSNVSPRRQKPLLHLGGEAMTIDPAEAKKTTFLVVHKLPPLSVFDSEEAKDRTSVHCLPRAGIKDNILQ